MGRSGRDLTAPGSPRSRTPGVSWPSGYEAQGQVWRNGRKQANLARVLAGVGIEALGRHNGKRIADYSRCPGLQISSTPT